VFYPLLSETGFKILFSFPGFSPVGKLFEEKEDPGPPPFGGFGSSFIMLIDSALDILGHSYVELIVVKTFKNIHEEHLN